MTTVVLLASLVVAGVAASVEAASSLDAAQAAATTSSGRSLAWQHTLGGATDRVLVVGVTTVDNQAADPGVAVSFGGRSMLAVPGAVAFTGNRSGRDHAFLRTQLFYLLEADLPGPGTYRVEVSLARTAREIGGGSTSMAGLAQAPPEAVITAVGPQASSTVTASLDVPTERSWIVQAVGADVARSLAPAGYPLAASAAGRGVSVAGSASMVGGSGPTELAWTLSGAGRITLVAAAFGPLRFPLSASVDGLGAVTPAPGLYPDGVTLNLQATSAPGHVFSRWSGDLTGSQNPASLAMDGPKAVVAHFVPDFALRGWATTNGGTTGGEGGPEVVVDTLAALKFYAERTDDPYVIKIAGTIIGNEAVRVRSNKSILGIGSDARLLGVGLQIGGQNEFGQIRNVVVRNITFEKALAPLDGVWVTHGAHNVWIDHCNFFSDRDNGVDYYDGLVDVTNGADFVTVSWNRFSEHFKTSLVGSGDTVAADPGHLTVTYHHNSFVDSGGRNPSVRFGLVHVFNNYYRDLDDYAIASRMGAQVVVEHNWFENVVRPIRADTTLSPIAGYVRGTDTNVFLNSGPNSITLPDATWVPPYDYPLDPVNDVPWIVARWAGVGVLPVEGDAPPPSAPTITVPPATQQVEPGQDATFSVLVDGTWPFTYQWFKDGNAIDGAAASTLMLAAVEADDAGAYTVAVANAAGTVTSAPATLIVQEPGGGGEGVLLQESFDDGDRTNQALPTSSAWFGSSSNFGVVGGELRMNFGSSRTQLTYFTDDQAQPVSLAEGDRITVRFTFRFSAFSSGTDNFRVGLLRSVANPAATNGTGFVSSGSPNTNARVTGDFGSSNPGSNVFWLYEGYAAMTTVGAASQTPVRFLARDKSHASLLGSTSAYTAVTGGTGTPSQAMAASELYRGTLRVTRTAGGNALEYLVERVTDGAVIMSFSTVDSASKSVAFDTVAFYHATGPSSTAEFYVGDILVERSRP